jgi:acyl transferase domain-containing protein/NADPH:quinone reductase-like Zn-dependent oxidoreductase/NAD(P)-dependent dehydrogenase (short-subunit alcohol dehydrogenase family)/acyl carrier protein
MKPAESDDREPIAIIGMSCRVPGANDPDALWDMVVDQREAVTPYPGGRTAELDAFYQRVGMPDGPASIRGGFLPDIDKFDTAFFEISPREAEWLDPQQKLLLEAGWEALEDGGVPLDTLRKEEAGVFVGVWLNEYERHAAANSQAAEFFLITGGPLYGTSSRLAYQFDLRGPDISVNAACGSSLVAVHLATRSLRSGECSIALAGGVNVQVRHEITQAFSRAGMLSPDGRCKFGDAAADGFVRSDGVGMLVLKRLSDAKRDGDRIRAVIRGTAMANDGRGSGLLVTPSAAGQRQAMLEAVIDAGVPAESVDYVEAHGTGTRAGDPIEVSAIASVFGRRAVGDDACHIGSVKSNVGHTESAAGVVSIVRTVQALQHRRFPATLHVSERNPAIDWDASGLILQREGCAWDKPNETPRRASVNGLGLTGTNAHVILEEAPQTQEVDPEVRCAYLLPISAASEHALKQRAKDIALALGSLREQENSLGVLSDFCYSASVRRSHLIHRVAVTGATAAELQDKLEGFAKGQNSASISTGAAEHGRKPKIAFVFPGQGSQWVGMGRELLRTTAVFRRAMGEIDQAIQRETGWSVLEQLEDVSFEEGLTRIDVVQPTLFAVEVALAEVWRFWGVIPEAVVGHSMGEVAAAHVAGILSLEDAAKIICRRSALLTRVAGAGAMVVVDLSRVEAERLTVGLEDKISVAVSNSPRSTVLAGDPATLDKIVETLEGREIFCRWIRVDVASHSPQMDPLTTDLSHALADVHPSPGSIPQCSTVKAGMIDPFQMDGSYWVANLREPVLFANAVEELLRQGFDMFVEMSPHPILVPFVEQTAEHLGAQVPVVGSLRREEAETATLLRGLGRLYTAGAEIAWKGIYPIGNLVKLPAYPWQRERSWIESAGAQSIGIRSKSGHPLTGEPLQTANGEWIWTATITAETHPWLKDHAVGGTAILPASAYVELAGAAAKIIFGGGTAAVERLHLTQAATLSQDSSLEFQVVATPEFQDVFAVKFFRRAGKADEWMQTADCTMRRTSREEAQQVELKNWEDAEFSSQTTSGTTHTKKMAELGYEYGPSFRLIDWLKLEQGTALAQIEIPKELRSEGYLLHPAVLDAALQVLGRLLIERGAQPQTLLPVAIESAEWREIPAGAELLYARATATADALYGDVDLFDIRGRLLVSIRGLIFRPLEQAAATLGELLYEIQWENLIHDQARPGAASGHWLLIADHSGGAGELAMALRGRGASTTVAHPAEILQETFYSGDALRGVVWLTPLDIRRDAILTDVQGILADGAAILSRLANSDDCDLSDARLWMVTRSTLQVENEPIASALGAGAWGFLASVSNEYPRLHPSSVDLPTQPLPSEADLLAELLLSDPKDDRIALRQTGRFAARLNRYVSDARNVERIPASQLRTTRSESEYFELVQNTPGSLTGFDFVAGWTEPPGEGEVEIAVEAAGLNFRDLLSAIGAHERIAGGRFGGECAGTVLRVGSGVAGFQPGDAVLAISACFREGMFASRVRVPAVLVVKKPEAMSFAQAAGIPCAFLTAWYGIVKLARLQKGERILIHAAAGGVGLAAVQIARWIGAEIYATVGSEEKREYLRSLGVRHIMHSRKLDFAREVLEATDGQGVDVVLNSLAGPAIAAGFESLGRYGRFIEIGKRDIWENNRIGLQPFSKNLSMFAVDLAQSVEDRREMVGSMFMEVMDLFRQGALEPLHTTLFPVSAASEAFQLMAKGGHIGKIVLNLQDETAMVRRDASRLSPDATYLITGGLGGLGLVTAHAFVEHGARHLVLTSRGPASEGAHQLTAGMEAKGAAITIRHADLSVDAEAGALLDEIRKTMPPLRGIVHAAGILDDAVLSGLSRKKFETVMAGKVSGAFALDARVASGELDFLVYYSSVAGVLGIPGQANYAAANSILDALAHCQRARGIPAISINWGTWADVGLAAAGENRGVRLASQGLQSLTREEGAALIMHVLTEAPAQVSAMRFSAGQWCASHPSAGCSGFLAKLVRESTAASRQDTDFADSLKSLAATELRVALTGWLRHQIATVLRLDVERVPDDRPLRSLGLDSLMALELRNRLERGLRLKLSATLVWNYPTLAAIAAHLEMRLAATHPVEAKTREKEVAVIRTSPVLEEQKDGMTAVEMLEAELLGAESLLKN